MKQLEPAGMKAGRFFRLSASDFIKVPECSEIFKLPARAAIYYDPSKLKFVVDESNLAIAVFLPPGYTVTYNAAYRELGNPRPLPLFSYAACSAHEGAIYACAVRVDRSLRHDSRFMDMKEVSKGISGLKRAYPKNRLVGHLEKCALSFNCPNAKNLFLNKYEAPLPTSPSCNARCAGCISYQPEKNCPVTQPRIKFIPTPEEIAEIALSHISKVKHPIVSFGQGCEGEPLLAAAIIERAIKLIRAKTSKGIINMNTNASLPDKLTRLFEAGLDTMRVSLNSCRELYYDRYYRPKGYSFKDVVSSIDLAKNKRVFVSLNYLTMPGFTDSISEADAFKKFIERHKIGMIQWRNLNYDPVEYFKVLKVSVEETGMVGVKEEIALLKKYFPKLRMGYFNPSPLVIARRERSDRRSNLTI